MKKVIAIMFALLLNFSFSVPVSAMTTSIDIVQPYYEITNDAQSKLIISGTTATCKSTANGKPDVTKIVAVQTLEKQGFLWFWDTYDDTAWTTTANSKMLTMSNTKSGLESGNYRLKTVFTLTDKQGKTETITVYSDEKAIS